MIRKLALCALCLCFVCAGGCATPEKNRQIDVDNLEGLRIGVGIAWSEDYVLSERSDTELFRYRDLGSMLLALGSGHVDAIGLNHISAKYVQAHMPSLQITESEVGRDKLVVFFANGRESMMEEFNLFLQNFKQTEEYQDIMYRSNHLENGFFAGKEVLTDHELPVIKIVGEQVYPYFYWDFEKNEAAGSDVEIAKHFAKAAGYTPEVQMVSYESAILQVSHGQADMIICALSTHFRSEVELNGTALVSEPYMDTPIMLVSTSGRAMPDGVPDALQ